MTPFKGQGCNQALKDGPLLASKLAKNPKNLHAAVVAFEREMIARTRVKVCSRSSLRAKHPLTPTNPFFALG
jgi:2-polyprenyl-6-methoxyphenol hydroxylase-like FAD-dependent oxidoreductase